MSLNVFHTCCPYTKKRICDCSLYQSKISQEENTKLGRKVFQLFSCACPEYSNFLHQLNNEQLFEFPAAKKTQEQNQEIKKEETKDLENINAIIADTEESKASIAHITHEVAFPQEELKNLQAHFAQRGPLSAAVPLSSQPSGLFFAGAGTKIPSVVTPSSTTTPSASKDKKRKSTSKSKNSKSNALDDSADSVVTPSSLSTPALSNTLPSPILPTMQTAPGFASPQVAALANNINAATVAALLSGNPQNVQQIINFVAQKNPQLLLTALSGSQLRPPAPPAQPQTLPSFQSMYNPMQAPQASPSLASLIQQQQAGMGMQHMNINQYSQPQTQPQFNFLQNMQNFQNMQNYQNMQNMQNYQNIQQQNVAPSMPLNMNLDTPDVAPKRTSSRIAKKKKTDDSNDGYE